MENNVLLLENPQFTLTPQLEKNMIQEISNTLGRNNINIPNNIIKIKLLEIYNHYNFKAYGVTYDVEKSKKLYMLNDDFKNIKNQVINFFVEKKAYENYINSKQIAFNPWNSTKEKEIAINSKINESRNVKQRLNVSTLRTNFPC